MFDVLVARSQAAVTAPELFVLLPEHAFARAASSRVTATVKRATSVPLGLTFLSGPEGSGKSLLACQTIRDGLRRHPKLQYIIATAVELTDLLSLAEEEQSLAELLDLFAALDLLVCEDLHELDQQQSRQECLLALVDRFSSDGPRILVTSRRQPGEFRDLSPRWVSRLHGGLCATVPWPALDGRRMLIERLAQARHLPLCEPVAPTIEWLALRWAFSPRDISRSLDQLAANCHAERSAIDLRYLERRQSQGAKEGLLSFDAIANVVALEFGVTPDDLRSRSRQQGLIVPRQCAMFLAKEMTGRPLETIGSYFGERTHTTVSHCLSRLKELLPHAPSLRQQVQKLRKRLSELTREDCA